MSGRGGIAPCRTFEVLADGLEVRLSVENLSDGTMPAMLGLHPYFPQPALATRAGAGTHGVADGRAGTAGAGSADARRTGHSSGREVPPASALDHCFDHWDGVAMRALAGSNLKISATGAESLHVYTPAGRRFLLPRAADGRGRCA